MSVSGRLSGRRSEPVAVADVPTEYREAYATHAFSAQTRSVCPSVGETWTSESDGSIAIRRGVRGEVVVVIPKKEKALCLAIAPVENSVWVALSDGFIRVYDAPTATLTKEFVQHDGPVHCITHFENRVFTGGADWKIYEWTLDSADYVRQFYGHLNSVRALQVHFNFSTNRWQLASASDDGTVKLWDPDAPAQHVRDVACVHSFKSHSKSVLALGVFAPRNQLWSGGENHAIRVHDLNTFQHLAVLEKHTGPITALETVHNRVWSGGKDGMIFVWDPVNLCAVREFSQGIRVTQRFISSLRVVRVVPCLRVWAATSDGSIVCFCSEGANEDEDLTVDRGLVDTLRAELVDVRASRRNLELQSATHLAEIKRLREQPDRLELETLRRELSLTIARLDSTSAKLAVADDLLKSSRDAISELEEASNAANHANIQLSLELSVSRRDLECKSAECDAALQDLTLSHAATNAVRMEKDLAKDDAVRWHEYALARDAELDAARRSLAISALEFDQQSERNQIAATRGGAFLDHVLFSHGSLVTDAASLREQLSQAVFSLETARSERDEALAKHSKAVDEIQHLIANNDELHTVVRALQAETEIQMHEAETQRENFADVVRRHSELQQFAAQTASAARSTVSDLERALSVHQDALVMEQHRRLAAMLDYEQESRVHTFSLEDVHRERLVTAFAFLKSAKLSRDAGPASSTQTDDVKAAALSVWSTECQTADAVQTTEGQPATPSKGAESMRDAFRALEDLFSHTLTALDELVSSSFSLTVTTPAGASELSQLNHMEQRCRTMIIDAEANCFESTRLAASSIFEIVWAVAVAELRLDESEQRSLLVIGRHDEISHMDRCIAVYNSGFYQASQLVTCEEVVRAALRTMEEETRISHCAKTEARPVKTSNDSALFDASEDAYEAATGCMQLEEELKYWKRHFNDHASTESAPECTALRIPKYATDDTLREMQLSGDADESLIEELSYKMLDLLEQVRYYRRLANVPDVQPDSPLQTPQLAVLPSTLGEPEVLDDDFTPRRVAVSTRTFAIQTENSALVHAATDAPVLDRGTVGTSPLPLVIPPKSPRNDAHIAVELALQDLHAEEAARLALTLQDLRELTDAFTRELRSGSCGHVTADPAPPSTMIVATVDTDEALIARNRFASMWEAQVTSVAAEMAVPPPLRCRRHTTPDPTTREVCRQPHALEELHLLREILAGSQPDALATSAMLERRSLRKLLGVGIRDFEAEGQMDFYQRVIRCLAAGGARVTSTPEHEEHVVTALEARCEALQESLNLALVDLHRREAPHRLDNMAPPCVQPLIERLALADSRLADLEEELCASVIVVSDAEHRVRDAEDSLCAAELRYRRLSAEMDDLRAVLVAAQSETRETCPQTVTTCSTSPPAHGPLMNSRCMVSVGVGFAQEELAACAEGTPEPAAAVDRLLLESLEAVSDRDRVILELRLTCDKLQTSRTVASETLSLIEAAARQMAHNLPRAEPVVPLVTHAAVATEHVQLIDVSVATDGTNEAIERPLLDEIDCLRRQLCLKDQLVAHLDNEIDALNRAAAMRSDRLPTESNRGMDSSVDEVAACLGIPKPPSATELSERARALSAAWCAQLGFSGSKSFVDMLTYLRDSCEDLRNTNHRLETDLAAANTTTRGMQQRIIRLVDSNKTIAEQLDAALSKPAPQAVARRREVELVWTTYVAADSAMRTLSHHLAAVRSLKATHAEVYRLLVPRLNAVVQAQTEGTNQAFALVQETLTAAEKEEIRAHAGLSRADDDEVDFAA